MVDQAYGLFHKHGPPECDLPVEPHYTMVAGLLAWKWVVGRKAWRGREMSGGVSGLGGKQNREVGGSQQH